MRGVQYVRPRVRSFVRQPPGMCGANLLRRPAGISAEASPSGMGPLDTGYRMPAESRELPVCRHPSRTPGFPPDRFFVFFVGDAASLSVSGGHSPESAQQAAEQQGEAQGIRLTPKDTGTNSLETDKQRAPNGHGGC